MAVLRASLAQIPIVLVSATPSLETVVNVARGRYRRVALPRRHGDAALPRSRAGRHAAGAMRAGPVPVAAAGRRAGARRWQPASRRCCSSTAAAMRR